MSEELTVTPSDNLTWEIEVPLLSNRAVVGGMARVFAITGAIICGLMAVLFGAQGEWELIAPVSAGLLGACVGLFVLSLLVMVLVFRNRIRFRFTVGDEGVRIETIDRTVRLVNCLAVGAGALGGSPQTAGAGLIGTGRETEGVRWEGSFRASYNDRARVAPRNAWRTLIVVYCTSENHAQVAGSFAARFLLVEALDVPLWIPLILLCFALAMVSFVGLFGWVVIAFMVVEAVGLLLNALSVRESFLRPGETYAHWTVFPGDDWALLGLASAGFLFLGRLSVRAVRGRLHSVLDSDFVDMGA